MATEGADAVAATMRHTHTHTSRSSSSAARQRMYLAALADDSHSANPKVRCSGGNKVLAIMVLRVAPSAPGTQRRW